MRRVLWVVGLLGALMIVAPFALGFPSKTSHGQELLNNFRPVMQQASVDKTAAYYNNVFVPLGSVVPAMSPANLAKFNAYLDGIKGMQTDSTKLIPGLAAALNMTPAQVQQLLATNYPAMSQMLTNLPQMQADFGNLLGVMSKNGGIKFIGPLVTTMQANVNNYKQADSLPNFRLFTWFFVVPGVLLLGLSTWGLAFSGQHRLAFLHHHPHTPIPGAVH
jgi:hypothetical protein